MTTQELRIQGKATRRKRPSVKERMTPCEVCGHPLSQRHHMMPFTDYGEVDWVAHLCANCHELWHLVYLAETKRSPYASRLLDHALPQLWGWPTTQEDRDAKHWRLQYLIKLVRASHEVQIKVRQDIASTVK